MPKERSILFSGGMVRAILDGRKSMTRWVIAAITPPDEWRKFSESALLNDPIKHYFINDNGQIVSIQCPYGSAGDFLWVRETFGPGLGDNPTPALGYVAYRADGEYPARLKDTHVWRTPRFMPRWASRITLKITDVRAERLQEISEHDAIAEGLASWPSDKVPDVVHYGITLPDVWETDPRLAFKRLWDSINVKRGFGWDTNPWVWIIRFERMN